MYNIIIPSLYQVLVASPILLVYLAGLILALVFWRRNRTPCLLALIATGLLLLLGVIQPFVSSYLFQARTEMGWTQEKLSSMLAVVGLATTCLRAAAMSLLVAGVFVGRRVSLQVGPNPEGCIAAERAALSAGNGFGVVGARSQQIHP
jgi:hypothetical protein